MISLFDIYKTVLPDLSNHVKTIWRYPTNFVTFQGAEIKKEHQILAHNSPSQISDRFCLALACNINASCTDSYTIQLTEKMRTPR